MCYGQPHHQWNGFVLLKRGHEGWSRRAGIGTSMLCSAWGRKLAKLPAFLTKSFPCRSRVRWSAPVPKRCPEAHPTSESGLTHEQPRGAGRDELHNFGDNFDFAISDFGNTQFVILNPRGREELAITGHSASIRQPCTPRFAAPQSHGALRRTGAAPRQRQPGRAGLRTVYGSADTATRRANR
jgi:hypothetical protein